MVRRWAAILGLALGILGCSDSGLPELGAGLSAEFACPCAAGFECDPVKKVCVAKGLVDAGGADQAGGDGAGDALADADAELIGDAPDVALADLDGLAEVETSVDVDVAELAETVGEIDAAELDVAEVGDADVEVDVGEDGDGDVEPADDVEADIAAEVEAGGADACVAVAELCNNKDDNCDGETDNGIQAVDTECLKLGVCASGTVGATCSAGKWLCSYSSVQFYEAATEITCDGLDNDCDGQTDEDFALGVQTLGGSCGVGACAGGKVACSADKKGLACDSSAKAAKESCNGKDDDCDGKTDEEFTYTVASSGAILAIGAPCGGGTCGVGAVECTPGKTDQATCSTDPNGSQVQGGSEICNDLDDDCDGTTDEGCDDDGDGYCDLAMVVVGVPKICPKGTGDCYDVSNLGTLVNPGAKEVCDNADNNCSKAVDEGCDDDGDQYCDGNLVVLGTPMICPKSAKDKADDCNDTNAKINPSGTELCDDLDNNCNGLVDEGCDDDKDTYCDALMMVVGAPKVCVSTKGTSTPSPGNDCNDDPAKNGSGVNPGKTESCATPGVDDNCDSKVDSEGAQNCTNLYADADLDGYGAGGAKCLCKPGDLATFTAVVPGDCNDIAVTGKSIFPGNKETCATSGDDNCDGSANDKDAVGCKLYYDDADGDGFGAGVGSCVCVADGSKKLVTTDSSDCNDNPSTGKQVFPGSKESCATAFDDNCNGITNEDCIAGMVMIPAGSFKMGCVAGDGDCAADENPQHTVTLDAFYIDQTEVTAAAYKKCVDAGKCGAPTCSVGGTHKTYGVVGKEQHPVNCVNWPQADAYCKWTDAKGRLPTEAEWEKAARGGLEGKKYPWGDQGPTCTPGQANTAVWAADGGWIGCSKPATWAVGTGSALNGSGMYDTSGNVWEWVSDWYSSSYYGSSPGSNPQGPAGGSYRTFRGGGTLTTFATFLRASMRYSALPTDGYGDLGFRCARSVVATTETVCDNLDDNANGQIDEGCDDDGDEYCDSAMTVIGLPNTCTNTIGGAAPGKPGNDCSDAKGGVNPGAEEVCGGGVDENCSGVTDEGCPPAGMALIPAGSFKMGCVPGDGDCAANENPQHTVTLDAFYIDQTEVTAAAYKKCVDAGKCGVPPICGVYANYGTSGREQHPVNCVTWTEADAYCRWTDPMGRLPTEAEWEKAARGGLDSKKYSWGDAGPTCTPGQPNSAVWTEGGALGCTKASTWGVGVGSSPNGFGLYDMLGNVKEWVSDWYGNSYYGSSPASSPHGPLSGAYRVKRGGAFGDNNPAYLRLSFRAYGSPSEAHGSIGFRCARPITPPGMAYVPAGASKMGCVPSDPDCSADEKPQHPVKVDAFLIDVHEVTVEKYKTCVGAGACTKADISGSGLGSQYCHWAQSGKEKYPINCVTWAQSAAYCNWIGGTLPTEAQWERAARGGTDDQITPWGLSIDCSNAVFDDGAATSGLGCDGAGSQVVGSRPLGANGYGLQDVLGNVAEWTADYWSPTYYSTSPLENPTGPQTGDSRVLRTGAPFEGAKAMRLSRREMYDASKGYYWVGFRCSKAP